MELIEFDGRKTRGRQKIEMKRIEHDNTRLEFSKRRCGIYKKASELATLTGAEIGIVLFSPTGKPFSFGQPTIDSVLNRYFQIPSNNDIIQPIFEAHQKKRTKSLRDRLSEAVARLQAEKKLGTELRKLIKSAREEKRAGGAEVGWWEARIENLSDSQLEVVEASVEEFYGDLMKHVNRCNNNDIDNNGNNNNNNNNVVGSAGSSLGPVDNGNGDVGCFEMGNGDGGCSFDMGNEDYLDEWLLLTRSGR